MRMLLGIVAGLLVAYGFMLRTKTQRSDDPGTSRLIDVPDPIARQQGNVALAVGVLLLLGVMLL